MAGDMKGPGGIVVPWQHSLLISLAIVLVCSALWSAASIFSKIWGKDWRSTVCSYVKNLTDSAKSCFPPLGHQQLEGYGLFTTACLYRLHRKPNVGLHQLITCGQSCMTRHHIVGQWAHILKKAVLHVDLVQSHPLRISACTEHVSANIGWNMFCACTDPQWVTLYKIYV